MADDRALGRVTTGRLVQELLGVGFAVEVGPDGVLVHGRGGEVWAPPVRLAMTDEDVRGVVRAQARYSLQTGADGPPVADGYRSLLSGLGEHLAREVLPGSTVTIADGWLRTRPTRRPVPEGPLRYLSDEQYRERFGTDPPEPDPVEPNPFELDGDR